MWQELHSIILISLKVKGITVLLMFFCFNAPSGHGVIPVLAVVIVAIRRFQNDEGDPLTKNPQDTKQCLLLFFVS